MIPITYARSRLWLGISGVGSIVLLSVGLLVSGIPLDWLPSSRSWSSADFASLSAMVACLVGLLIPLDVLGGYLLPNRSRPGTITAGSFAAGWIRGVVIQASLFLMTSLIVLTMGRAFGLLGATLAVLGVGCFLLAMQLPIAKLVGGLRAVDDQEDRSQAKIAEALRQTNRWGWKSRPVVAMNHTDTGFTGGIIGLPGWETIVVPASSLVELTPEELAATFARRLEAIQNGSRTRGMLFGLVWVGLGFVLSANLPGAGVASVGELAMTCLGFTLWTFVGLLTLPTLSRQASYAVDQRVVEHGTPAEILHGAIAKLDCLQDDEPRRPVWVETIFHPVPSVENRRGESTSSLPIAWHAARMMLYVSWGGMGMLARAVHCNVGRPQLWVMLPTD